MIEYKLYLYRRYDVMYRTSFISKVFIDDALVEAKNV